ncbi:cyclic nucleotide-gated cation channel alpha-3-like isoform X2 [Paramacrobiotus metropolitanus]|nr:cyclic nucleotide-gated cation channel alpha-3-like isoform X2 [Paramacrobiotus metropolitanus]
MKSVVFVLDVVSIVPTDFAYFFHTRQGGNWAWRLNRCLKVHRVFECIERMTSHSSFPMAFRLGRILFYLLVLIHLTGCAYYSLNVYIGFGYDGWTIENYGNSSEGQFVNLYVRCLHWATVILADEGDNSKASLVIELLFRCYFTLKGHILVGTIIAIVASIFGNNRRKLTRFRQQLDGIKTYMAFRHVDEEMQDRVLKWATFMWEERKFQNSENDLEILPVPLRRSIAKAAQMDTFQRVQLFVDCEPQFLEELIMRLELQVFSPGDLICRKGDVGKEMYIVRSGTLQVVSEQGEVFANLAQGSVFGEISLLSIFTKHENRRTANVQSFSYSELFSLSSGDFKEVLESFPVAREKMIAKSRELLKDRTLSEVVHTNADEDTDLSYKIERLQNLSQETVLLIESFTKTIITDTVKLKKRLAALEALASNRERPHPTRTKAKLAFAQTPV